jgi:hypothetical protein
MFQKACGYIIHKRKDRCEATNTRLHSWHLKSVVSGQYHSDHKVVTGLTKLLRFYQLNTVSTALGKCTLDCEPGSDWVTKVTCRQRLLQCQ